MAAEIVMPRLSDTMEEGRIIRWLKKVGEPVKEGELLLEVETDKADIEVEAFNTGILIEITAEEGETIKVGEKIGLIGSSQEAEGIKQPQKEAPKEAPAEARAEEQPAEEPEERAAVEEIIKEEKKPKAKEAEKRKAEEEKKKKAQEEEAAIRRKEEEQRKKFEEEARKQAEEKKKKPGPEEPAVSIHMTQREAIERFVAKRAPEKAAISPLARELAQKHGIDISDIKGTGPNGEIVKRDIEQAVSARAEKEPAAKIEVRKKAREIRATPLAVVLAEKEGVDLDEVRGTGIEGRIRETDVKAYVARRCRERGEEFRELSLMRKTIARRMTLSQQTIPHFYLSMRIDMDAAVALRKKLNEGKPDEEKISFNDLVVKAAALALDEIPEVNSSYIDDKIRVNKQVNVGIATATPDGLIVPVIMDADKKAVAEIAREARDKAERARKRKLRPDEYSNATFTISNLGMFGIEHFTAIIDPGQSAILAVGALAQEPVVLDGQLKPKNIMRVTLSCDHRVIDGYTGAQFLIKLKEVLEKPESIAG